MSRLPIYPVPASAQHAGTMPAAAYAAYAGVAPEDPTEDVPTTGASTFTKALVTVTSSIDPSISITCRYCYCNEHIGTGNMVSLVCVPGFGTPHTMYDDTFLERVASYIVDGRAFVVIAVSPRGRTPSTGTNDAGARESTDLIDAFRAVVATIGASAFDAGGGTAAFYGISTGAHNVGMLAVTHPDYARVLVMAAPNWDLGRGPNSYWSKQASSRSYLRTWVGDRAPGSEDDLAPYIVRDFSAALPEYLELSSAYHLFVLYDWTESQSIPLPDSNEFVERLRASPAAASKVHVHRTVSGDAHRILHDEAQNGPGLVWHERVWVPHALRAGEWTMPAVSPKGGLPMLGRLAPRAQNWQAWTGLNTSPKPASDLAITTALSGGCQHAGRLSYRTGRQFEFDPMTSKDGAFQVIRESENRVVALTAGTRAAIDLDVTPTIATLADLSVTRAWHSDAGISASPVTLWSPDIGTGDLSTAIAAPATGTDADGKTYVGFTAASQHSLKVDLDGVVGLNGDFVIGVVVAATNNTMSRILGYTHVVHNTGGYLQLRKAPSGAGISWAAGAYYDTTHNALSTDVGHNLTTAAAKRMLILMRKAGVFYMSTDDSPWSRSGFTTGAFGTTPMKLVLGAVWDNTIDQYYYFADVRYYAVFAAPTAWTEAQRAAARVHYITRFALPSIPQD